MLQFDPIPIKPETLPGMAQAAMEADASIERRMALARAVLPMDPEDLVTTLMFLCHDKSEGVSRTARTTLDGLPWGVLSAGISGNSNQGALDTAARELGKREGILSLVASNPNSADTTIAFIASRGDGEVLDIVARNQVRYQRFPRIIEAIYYNPKTRMGTVSDVLENAVRLGIDLSHIPGYLEIVTSIMGEDALLRMTAPPPRAPAGVPPPAARELPDTTPSADEMARALDDMLGAAGGGEWGFTAAGMEGALDEDAFGLLLQAAAWDEGTADEEGDGREDKSLYAQLQNLPIPQKVRLALLGNESVRGLLVRDGKRVVFMSVLKSPRLTDKEIVKFAQNKALNEEIARTIAANKDWTKLYAVRLALVTNPKTPPIQALQFMRTLTGKDLKNLTTSRDVPGYIVRGARQAVAQREAGKHN